LPSAWAEKDSTARLAKASLINFFMSWSPLRDWCCSSTADTKRAAAISIGEMHNPKIGCIILHVPRDDLAALASTRV
jgi:hypothetical protein